MTQRRTKRGGERHNSSFILHPSSFEKARLLVVGDVMLDRYWFGEVGRISPEAPVPVVFVVNETYCLGGSANVAANVQALDGRATATLVSGRGNFSFSPRMLLAALLQYNSTINAMTTNVRFRWEYRPGSELVLVYTEGRSVLEEHLRPLDRFGAPTSLQNRGFVVKLNRLFRL